MKNENASVKRYRNFATVVYPESAPDLWEDALSDFHIPAIISPIHDRDLNPTGEEKKPHYHVLLMYDSVKTIDQARSVFDFIGGVGCEVVNSLRGYSRYLCHLDNPDKAQYAIDDVRCFSGADFFGIISLPIDKYKSLSEMCDFCKENSLYSFSALSDYARKNRFDWWRVLCDCGAYYMRSYLRSLEWSAKCLPEPLEED